MKNTIISLLFGVFTLLVAVPAYAAGGASGVGQPCVPIYGGGQTCVAENLLVNKTVQNPQTGNFVDNLGVNDPKYAPGQTVTFQLSVTNTGNTTLSTVRVVDTFPQFVSFSAGVGNFDPKTKKLSFDVANLQPGETRTFTLLGKVAEASELPNDKAVVCVVNNVEARADNAQGVDNAQFCIQKEQPTPTAGPSKGGVPGVTVPEVTKGGLKVFPQPKVVTTPPTGPEVVALLGLLPTGLFGAVLRKKASF